MVVAAARALFPKSCAEANNAGSAGGNVEESYGLDRWSLMESIQRPSHMRIVHNQNLARAEIQTDASEALSTTSFAYEA